MHAPSDDTLAPLVARAEQGDRPAREALFTALYADLHRLAQAQLRRAAGPPTLGTTTLLHEAYLEISQRDATASWDTPPAPCAAWSSITCATAPSRDSSRVTKVRSPPRFWTPRSRT